MLRAAAQHRGSAFVEIYQNCNIYNDGAFDFVREQKENRLYLRHGEPITWGEKGVRLLPGRLARGRRRDRRRACSCTTRTRTSRRTRSRSRGSRSRRSARRRWASSAQSSARSTTS